MANVTNGNPQPGDDSRFYYGSACTWYGTRQEISVGGYQKKDPAEHFPPMLKDKNAPCCPCCGGMLYELPDESAFWSAIQAFERGDYKQPGGLGKPHPGYREMWEWQRMTRTCFTTAEMLALTYKMATNVIVDIAP